MRNSIGLDAYWPKGKPNRCKHARKVLMSQERETEPSVLERTHPEAIAEWKRRATTAGPGRAWTDYIILLNHFAEALSRAPYTAEACETVNIVELVNTEFAYLAEALAFIFPNGVMAHKSYETETRERQNE
jgi:hypothetical protein